MDVSARVELRTLTLTAGGPTPQYDRLGDRRQSNDTPTAVQRQSQQTLQRGANGDELKRVAYHFALAVTTGW